MPEQSGWFRVDCPYCTSKNFRTWRTVGGVDTSSSSEPYTIVSCEDCGLRYLNPRPPWEIRSREFESSDTNWITHILRQWSLWRKRLIIEEFQSGARLLDVGVDAGFPVYMHRYHWDVTAVQQFGDFHEALTPLGIQVFENMESLPSDQYDVVTVWDSLGQFENLTGLVESLAGHTLPGGFLLLSVPAIDSWEAKRYQVDWAGFEVPRRITWFTEKDIKKLFSGAPFRLVTTRSVWSDAVRQTMESELRHRHREQSRIRVIYMMNTLLGSYLNDRQQQVRQAPESVYIFRKENCNA
ncbi:MAG: class I SAM-dependent methyltransferase [Candidatus Marinimicrobia bacterium]|nr:class I SAM-dependent methyltransferase [Candidatus Neomarinimicrobiota bacterium]MCF7880221.1 class I SAM-dependent methyltransferase [Candidatus Neomarinimicrobiota bacterium]